MGNSIPQKTRYTLAIVSFIVFFLFTIFLFSKRTLEPFVTVYQNSFSLTKSHTHTSSVSNVPHHPLNSSSSAHHLIPSISQVNDVLGPSSSTVSIDDHLSAPDTDAVDSGEKYTRGSSNTISVDGQNRNPPAVTDAIDNGKEYNRGSSYTISVDGQNRNPPAVTDAVDNGEEKERETCDLYKGTWVKDQGYPIYKPGACPYVDEGFDCQTNGRKDTEYLKWRWKPDGCDLPRYGLPCAFFSF